eukprot:IDg5072t1
MQQGVHNFVDQPFLQQPHALNQLIAIQENIGGVRDQLDALRDQVQRLVVEATDAMAAAAVDDNPAENIDAQTEPHLAGTQDAVEGGVASAAREIVHDAVHAHAVSPDATPVAAPDAALDAAPDAANDAIPVARAVGDHLDVVGSGAGSSLREQMDLRQKRLAFLEGNKKSNGGASSSAAGASGINNAFAVAPAIVALRARTTRFASRRKQHAVVVRRGARMLASPAFVEQQQQQQQQQQRRTTRRLYRVRLLRAMRRWKPLLGTLLMLVTPLLFATAFMTFFEGWQLIDALYFAVAVATTVGYGDLAPHSSTARVFVALYAIFCAARVGALLAAVVDGAARAVLSRRRHHVQDAAESEAAALARVRATALLLTCVVLAGLVVYGSTLHLSALDALYFVAVTVSTVGLGDVHPATPGGRAFATAWLVFGALGFANLLARYAEWRACVARRKALDELAAAPFSSLAFRAMDTDRDGRLSQAEFLGYAVCKLGVLAEHEVRAIINQFEKLDGDASGFISKEDVIIDEKQPPLPSSSCHTSFLCGNRPNRRTMSRCSCENFKLCSAMSAHSAAPASSDVRNSSRSERIASKQRTDTFSSSACMSGVYMNTRSTGRNSFRTALARSSRARNDTAIARASPANASFVPRSLPVAYHVGVSPNQYDSTRSVRAGASVFFIVARGRRVVNGVGDGRSRSGRNAAAKVRTVRILVQNVYSYDGSCVFRAHSHLLLMCAFLQWRMSHVELLG